jgi:hypothetical protein
MRPTPWDLRLAARTLALAVVALVAIALIEWFTSERGAAGSSGAAIGPLPLTPVAAAVAVSIALAPARASGELRALSALGASPLRSRAAALAVAAALGLFAAAAITAGRVEASPLYPSVRPRSDWRVTSAGTVEGAVTFESARRGARLLDDRVERMPGASPAPTPEGTPPHGRGAAAAAVALASLALAAFASSPLRKRPVRTLLAAAIYGTTQVAAFQIAAARALPAFCVAAPPAALLLLVALELRGERRLDAEEAWL